MDDTARWLLLFCCFRLQGIMDPHFECKGVMQPLIISCYWLAVKCIRYFCLPVCLHSFRVWVLCCWESLLIASFHQLVFRWRGLIKFCREQQLPAFPSQCLRAAVLLPGCSTHTPQTHKAVKSIPPNRVPSRYILTSRACTTFTCFSKRCCLLHLFARHSYFLSCPANVCTCYAKTSVFKGFLMRIRIIMAVIYSASASTFTISWYQSRMKQDLNCNSIFEGFFVLKERVSWLPLWLNSKATAKWEKLCSVDAL